MEVVLETPRLILCKHRAEDLDDIMTMLGDIRVMRWVSGRVYPREEVAARLEKIIEFEANHPYGFYVARTKDTGEFVGEGGIIPITRTGNNPADYNARGPEIEVGYRLRFDHWGKGYATEITRAALAHGFETVGLNRIIAVTNPDNAASQAVLFKCGLRYIAPTDAYYSVTCALFDITRADTIHA